jgi:hypothetical protein
MRGIRLPLELKGSDILIQKGLPVGRTAFFDTFDFEKIVCSPTGFIRLTKTLNIRNPVTYLVKPDTWV